ncbi:MAG: DsbA family protein [Bacteroides sp.]|nr:DsbA family protein [Bacteroides sp.]
MRTLCQKAALFLATCAAMLRPAVACGPDYDPDSYYYNLFLQEIVEDETYRPFLFIPDAPFYSAEKSRVRNENIEEWQEYLGIPYEEARYLVFEADTSAIHNLLKGANTEDPQLGFIRPAFLKKHRQGLEYMVCAKELEPYMHILPSGNSWYYSPDLLTVGDLDYVEVASRLKTG